MGVEVVVDPWLAGVVVGRRDPFGAAVAGSFGGPVGLFDQQVGGLAGQGHFVDVRVPAVREVAGVVDFAPVERHRARRVSAAAIAGEQGQALGGGGAAFGPAEIEHLFGVVVEHRQIVAGLPGHADQVADRDPVAAAGVRPPCGAFEFSEGGGGHDAGRDPGDPAGGAGFDRVAHRSGERVVIALGGGAAVAAGDGVVVGQIGPGGGVFGCDDVPVSPPFGGEPA